jgi:hypothetical protein
MGQLISCFYEATAKVYHRNVDEGRGRWYFSQNRHKKSSYYFKKTGSTINQRGSRGTTGFPIAT